MSEQKISKSKKKRLALIKERNAKKRKALVNTFFIILIPVIIVGLIALLIRYKSSNKFDYGKYLNSDGTINVDTSDYVTGDYKELSFSKSSLTATDDVIEAELSNLLSSHSYLSDNKNLVTKIDDNINVYFTAYLDGEVYGKADAESGGADITIGNDTGMPDEFNKMLLNHKAGDTYTTDITFPDDYPNADISGKTVQYEITINGIYELPELTDEFVKTNYPEYASSVSGLKEYIANNYYDSNLEQAIKNSLKEKYNVSSYPKKYADHLAKIIKKQYSSSSYNVASLEDAINELAISQTKDFLIYQDIYEKAGMTNTESDVKDFLMSDGMSESTYKSYVNDYGKKYVAHMALEGQVIEYLKNNVTITE